MIITATLKELKTMLPSLNYDEDEEVTFMIGEDSETYNTFFGDRDEEVIDDTDDEEDDEENEDDGYVPVPLSLIKIGGLEKDLVKRFGDNNLLKALVGDCMEEARKYTWEKNPKTGIYDNLSRLNSTSLGKIVVKYATTSGLPNWIKVNTMLSKVLDDNKNMLN